MNGFVTSHDMRYATSSGKRCQRQAQMPRKIILASARQGWDLLLRSFGNLFAEERKADIVEYTPQEA